MNYINKKNYLSKNRVQLWELYRSYSGISLYPNREPKSVERFTKPYIH